VIGSGKARGQATVVGKGVPRNLLHNIPHESGALAEVALGARDTGLHLARGDLLYTRKPGQPVFLVSQSFGLSLDVCSSLIFLGSQWVVDFGVDVRGPC
jgi:hypothetical protein